MLHYGLPHIELSWNYVVIDKYGYDRTLEFLMRGAFLLDSDPSGMEY
jgi:hypothetical protein